MTSSGTREQGASEAAQGSSSGLPLQSLPWLCSAVQCQKGVRVMKRLLLCCLNALRVGRSRARAGQSACAGRQARATQSGQRRRDQRQVTVCSVSTMYMQCSCMHHACCILLGVHSANNCPAEGFKGAATGNGDKLIRHHRQRQLGDSRHVDVRL